MKLKFKKQTIAVPVTKLDEPVTLNALVYGDWAIHYTIGFKGDVYTDSWAVTHVPTKCYLVHYISKQRDARKCIAELLEVFEKAPLVWESKDDERIPFVITNDHKTQMKIREICYKYGIR